MGSSIDYSSELGDTYMRLRREYAAGGKQPHWRPAANRDEKLRAQEVNRKVTATHVHVHRYARETEMEGTPQRLRVCCAICGRRMQPGSARLWRQVWGKDGRIDVYVHAGGCPGSSRKQQQRKERTS